MRANPRWAAALGLLAASLLLLACGIGPIGVPLGASGPQAPVPTPAALGPASPGPPGNFAGFDAASGRETLPWPRADGPIHAIAPDGAGGWYLGGMFGRVGDVDRPNLAHVRADGSVDPAWSPEPTGWVWSLAAADGRLYVCSSAPNSDGPDLISARDGVTGATLWSLATDATSQLMICPLLPGGETLYVGGSFTQLGGQARGGLAALDAETGAPLAWAPQLGLGSGGSLGALALAGETLYAGGSAIEPSGQSRAFLATVDTATGAVQPWELPTDGTVLALALDGNTVYAGGQSQAQRGFLLALEASGGAPLPAERQVALDDSRGVSSLLARDGTLYVGGDFPLAGRQAATRLFAVEIARPAELRWSAELGAPDGSEPVVFALASAGSQLVVGGSFVSTGGGQP